MNQNKFLKFCKHIWINCNLAKIKILNFIKWLNKSEKNQIIITLLIYTLITFLRNPRMYLTPCLAGESGNLYFYQFMEYGLHSFRLTCNNYIVLIPRLIAYISTDFFPLEIVPLLYAFFSYFAIILLCLYLFNKRIKLPYKPFLVLALAFIPDSGGSINALFFTQTFTSFFLILLLIVDPPKNKIDYIMDYLILLLVGFTGPYLVFLLPFFILRNLYLTHKLKNKKPLFFLGAALLISFIQVSNAKMTIFTNPAFIGNNNPILNLLDFILFKISPWSAYYPEHIFYANIVFFLIIDIFVLYLIFQNYKTTDNNLNKNNILWIGIVLLLFSWIVIILGSYVWSLVSKGPLGLASKEGRYFIFHHIALMWVGLILLKDKTIYGKLAFKMVCVVMLSMLIRPGMFFAPKQIAPSDTFNKDWKIYVNKIRNKEKVKFYQTVTSSYIPELSYKN